MILVCHVVLQDHVIKGSCSFVAVGNVGIMVLACHAISQQHVIKGSC